MSYSETSAALNEQAASIAAELASARPTAETAPYSR